MVPIACVIEMLLTVNIILKIFFCLNETASIRELYILYFYVNARSLVYCVSSVDENMSLSFLLLWYSVSCSVRLLCFRSLYCLLAAYDLHSVYIYCLQTIAQTIFTVGISHHCHSTNRANIVTPHLRLN